MDKYQVTGNEYVSLPTIREADGAVEGISFLMMGLKGMLELRGAEGLVKPWWACDGTEQPLAPKWRRDHCWIPGFASDGEGMRFNCMYLAPIGERGFGIRMTAENRSESARRIDIGLRGSWDETLHTVNESLPLESGRQVKRSNWNHMFVFQQAPGTPLFAFAPIVMDDQPFSEIDQGAVWTQEGFAYSIGKSAMLAPGERATLDVFFGVGYEEVAAAASAKEMLRQGFDALLDRTNGWLSQRERRVQSPELQAVLNTNLFFAFFFASGRTIDTEELCMMTSRSPRYYVSAAYWDRDSLLWAFPAILEADADYARELLLAVFHRQGRNFGVHSRYIDGTVLEPGFELDELCAPVIALARYIEATGDAGVLGRREIREALESVLAKLEERRNPTEELYSTFLQPTDDMRNHPYLTYDNALVWKALRHLGAWLSRPDLIARAARVREAIYAHCVVEHRGRRVFAWSVDMNGHWDIYDEPPGSLQLLPFYGFCATEDEIWKNTALEIRDAAYPLSFAGRAIAEIGCKHAPHPWVLSICNSLLSGHEGSAIEHLARTELDNGIACESVHEDTGECATGSAFATCAGFLAYALCKTVEGETGKT